MITAREVVNVGYSVALASGRPRPRVLDDSACRANKPSPGQSASDSGWQTGVNRPKLVGRLPDALLCAAPSGSG